MIEILFDIHLNNAVLSMRVTDDQKALKQQYYDAIFAKHGTTSDQFKESIEWYSKNPKKLEVIYDEVDLRLTKMEEDVNNFVYHPHLNPANDSLRTIDVWLKKMPKKIMAQNADSLSFEWDDSLVLCQNDTLIWKFLLTTNEPDSGQCGSVTLGISYVNNLADTITYQLQNGNKKRQITFRYVLPEKPAKVWGIFYSPTNVADSQIVALDTVEMLRIFNKNRYPLYETWHEHLDTLQNPKKEVVEPKKQKKLLKKAKKMAKSAALQ